MTPDQAIAIRVRLDTAIMALKEAYQQIPRPLAVGDADEASENVQESLEEAIQAAETALVICHNASGVIGA